MMIRFDSQKHSSRTPGAGFSLTVEAYTSGQLTVLFLYFFKLFFFVYYIILLSYFFLFLGGGVSRELFTESQEWAFLLLFILDLQSVNVKWDILHEKEFVFNYDLILNYDISFSFLRVKEIGTACSIGTWTFNRNFLSESEHKIR